MAKTFAIHDGLLYLSPPLSSNALINIVRHGLVFVRLDEVELVEVK